jgi:glyoxylase-like metal-dependent hydrolase (beta-lactamase superfamily II)/rhodanese-related sulfurtransferase
MIFRQFRHGGCLSYLLGDEKTGEGAVIDPLRDVDPYVEAAAQDRLRILYAIDTHSQADHVTGAGRLAGEAGARVVMSEHVERQREASEGKGDEIGIGEILRENAAVEVDQRVREGDEIAVGGLSLEVLFTPGHTQDAVCLLLEDRIFTGDTLMIGLCGRADLPGGNTEMLYNSLFETLYNLREDLLVYPSHDYRGNTNSALGYEKVNNPFLQPREPEEFAEFVRGVFPPPKGAGMQCGVVETKMAPGTAPSTGPLMGEMCIAIERLFQEYPADWRKWNIMTVRELREKLDAGEEVLVLDVREPEEYRSEHIPGARNIPVRELPKRAKELPADKDAEIVTHCESGFRSAHAAIFLKAYGYTHVKNLEHGIHEWREEGYDVEQ